MIYRYANEILGLDTSNRANLFQYEDMNDIADWAADAMAWAVAEELIAGRTSTILAPSAATTRAEAATLLMRFLEMTKDIPLPV